MTKVSIAKLILLFCSSKKLRLFFLAVLRQKHFQVIAGAPDESSLASYSAWEWNVDFAIADEVKQTPNHNYSAHGNRQENIQLWINILRDKWCFRAEDKAICVY